MKFFPQLPQEGKQMKVFIIVVLSVSNLGFGVFGAVTGIVSPLVVAFNFAVGAFCAFVAARLTLRRNQVT